MQFHLGNIDIIKILKMEKTETYLYFPSGKYLIDKKNKISHQLVEEKEKINNSIVDTYTVCGINGKFKIKNQRKYVNCTLCINVLKEYNKLKS